MLVAEVDVTNRDDTPSRIQPESTASTSADVSSDTVPDDFLQIEEREFPEAELKNDFEE